MYVPPEIIFKGGTLEEIGVACMDLLFLFANVDKRGLQRDSEAYKKLDAISKRAREATDPWLESIKQTIKDGPQTITSERIISNCIQEKLRIPAVAVYDNLHNYENDFQIGSDRKTTARQVVLISLTNLDIVDEKSLTWEQVSEFRKDKVLQGKYRRFLHWLNAEMVRKSEDEIQNEIGRKLDDYEQTLRIHGIKTIKGTLQWVLSGKPLAKSLAVGGGFAALTNSPLGAFLVGGGYLVKEVAFHIWESSLELLQLEAKHRDIAWVYDAKHKLETT